MRIELDVSGELNPQSYASAPELGGFVDYWRSKSCNGAIPRRTDIDPIELKKDLGSLFIVEPSGRAKDFRFRLVGADLTTLLGQEFTGTTLREISPPTIPHGFGPILAAYRTVVRERAVLRASGRICWARTDHLEFDSVHVPVLSPSADAIWIIGKMIVRSSSFMRRIPASLQSQWSTQPVRIWRYA